MKEKKLITVLLFAVVKMTAMADVAGPTYHYHALLFPEWLASKAGMPNGLVLGVLFSLAFIVLNYIRIRRRSGSSFLCFVRKHWVSNIMLCLLCLVGCLVRYVVIPDVQLAAATFGGRVDVSVKPNPNESYSQYQERTRRLENDLCLKCGTKMEHWYDRGRHAGCPKCDELYGTCKECGKEFKRFNRGAFLFSALEGGVDPGELCNACSELHGIKYLDQL